MNIIVSDLIMDNLDSFAEFVIKDFWKIFPRDNSRFIQSSVCRSKTLGTNLNTIDYKWIENDTNKIHGCTHCFIYLSENRVNISQHGQDKENNKKHWDYIIDNLPIFERDLTIEKVLE
tara:strand:+ start:8755 stop:9108 length:354 start_codon:yes stop_codon:yes gene_type:complete